MKKTNILALLLLPVIVLGISGCYTQFDERERDYYRDRDYSSENYNDEDTSGYSDDNNTIVNNNYYDSPYSPTYRRYFDGYYPSISIGAYYGYAPYYWDAFYDGPWCGSYFGINYPLYWGYHYYYPDYYYHYHYGYSHHDHDFADYRYRDGNMSRFRNADGGRATSINRNGLNSRTALNSVSASRGSRIMATGSTVRGNDRIGSIRREVVSASSTSRSARAISRPSASSWSRDSYRGSVDRSAARNGINNNSGYARPSRVDNSARRDAVSSTGRQSNASVRAQRDNSANNRSSQSNTSVDRSKRNYVKEYREQAREQKRERNILQRDKKSERKLYSTPRSDGQRRESSPRQSSGQQQRSSSSSGRYSAPSRGSSQPSAPSTPQRSSGSQSGGGRENRR